jgi:hypothetical protein
MNFGSIILPVLIVILCHASSKYLPSKSQITVALSERDSTNKKYIGSRLQNLCFDNYIQNQILILSKSGNKIIDYPVGANIEFINDYFICYSSKWDGRSNSLVIVTNTDTIHYLLSQKIVKAVGNNSGDICLNLLGSDTIYQLNAGDTRISTTHLIGNVQWLSDNFVYYTVVIPIEGTTYANVNLLRNSYPVAKKDEILLRNISGEAVTVLRDTFIFDKRLIGGEFKPILFNMISDKEIILYLDEKFKDSTPYLSEDGTSVVFYNSKSLQETQYHLIDLFKEK